MNIKDLLKNKKVIGGAAAVLVVGIAVSTALLLPRSSPPKDPEPNPSSSAVAVQPPTVSTPEGTGSTPTDESTAPGIDTEPSDVTVELESQTPTTSSKPTGGDSSKAEEPAKPVTPVEPEQPDNPGGGIQIGGGDTTEEYNCGSKNHHCEGPETHAFIQNLELEGCPYCESHTCPSFYATDEWGGAMLDITKCPKYDVKKDPLKYCQDCGKKTGDGTNDTCAQFVVDSDCPRCGEHVKAWDCHSCK